MEVDSAVQVSSADSPRLGARLRRRTREGFQDGCQSSDSESFTESPRETPPPNSCFLEGNRSAQTGCVLQRAVEHIAALTPGSHGPISRQTTLDCVRESVGARVENLTDSVLARAMLARQAMGEARDGVGADASISPMEQYAAGVLAQAVLSRSSTTDLSSELEELAARTAADESVSPCVEEAASAEGVASVIAAQPCHDGGAAALVADDAATGQPRAARAVAAPAEDSAGIILSTPERTRRLPAATDSQPATPQTCPSAQATPAPPPSMTVSLSPCPPTATRPMPLSVPGSPRQHPLGPLSSSPRPVAVCSAASSAAGLASPCTPLCTVSRPPASRPPSSAASPMQPGPPPPPRLPPPSSPLRPPPPSSPLAPPPRAPPQGSPLSPPQHYPSTAPPVGPVGSIWAAAALPPSLHRDGNLAGSAGDEAALAAAAEEAALAAEEAALAEEEATLAALEEEEAALLAAEEAALAQEEAILAAEEAREAALEAERRAASAARKKAVAYATMQGHHAYASGGALPLGLSPISGGLACRSRVPSSSNLAALMDEGSRHGARTDRCGGRAGAYAWLGEALDEVTPSAEVIHRASQMIAGQLVANAASNAVREAEALKGNAKGPARTPVWRLLKLCTLCMALAAVAHLTLRGHGV